MHDRKIPNITSTRIYPTVKSSYDSPRKYDHYKKPKQETSIWKRLWPKYRVHSQQYRKYYPGIYSGRLPQFFTAEDITKRSYKATHGDGRPIEYYDKPHNVFDCENEIWSRDVDTTGSVVPTKPHEHAEAEEKSIAEEEAIWGEISHDYTHIEDVESDGKREADIAFKKLFKNKKF